MKRGVDSIGSSLLTLRKLPLGYRVLYTGILFFFVLGSVAGVAQQQLRAGLTPRGAAEWIHGNEDDLDADRFLFAKDGVTVLDEVWRGSLAAVIPSIVILALLLRSGAPSAWRGGVAALLAVSSLGEITGPAVVFWIGPEGGWIWWLAQIGFPLATVIAAAMCIEEMWGWRGEGARLRNGSTS